MFSCSSSGRQIKYVCPTETGDLAQRKKSLRYLVGEWKCKIFKPINFCWYRAQHLQDCFLRSISNYTQLKHAGYNTSVDILQQLVTKSRYQNAFAWLATACWQQICCKWNCQLTCCKLIVQTCYPQLCCNLFQQVVTSVQMTSCDKPDFNRLVATWWNCCYLLTSCNKPVTGLWCFLDVHTRENPRTVGKQFSFSRINELCLGNGFWTWCRRQQETPNVDRSLSV